MRQLISLGENKRLDAINLYTSWTQKYKFKILQQVKKNKCFFVLLQFYIRTDPQN